MKLPRIATEEGLLQEALELRRRIKTAVNEKPNQRAVIEALDCLGLEGMKGMAFFSINYKAGRAGVSRALGMRGMGAGYDGHARVFLRVLRRRIEALENLVARRENGSDRRDPLSFAVVATLMSPNGGTAQGAFTPLPEGMTWNRFKASLSALRERAEVMDSDAGRGSKGGSPGNPADEELDGCVTRALAVQGVSVSALRLPILRAITGRKRWPKAPNI